MKYISSILTLIFFIAVFLVLTPTTIAQAQAGAKNVRDFSYNYTNSTWTISYNGVPVTIEQKTENTSLLQSYKLLLDRTKKDVLIFQSACASLLLTHLILSFLFIFKFSWLTTPVVLVGIAIIFISANTIYSNLESIYSAFNNLRFYYYSLSAS
ncbi:hypothetical protein [Solibacillus sp. CAU 1738]|uniref:hypothetical protein n=1 Tax=Solibacillus sp. CAU 1738 TaxID=3140363 RepID=UPI003260C12F